MYIMRYDQAVDFCDEDAAQLDLYSFVTLICSVKESWNMPSAHADDLLSFSHSIETWHQKFFCFQTAARFASLPVCRARAPENRCHGNAATGWNY